MKRFFHFMTVIALAALTLTGCDDVPMPYNQPNIKPNEPTVTPSGTGTAEDPYNVAAALQLVNSLGADETTANAIYVKGKVTGTPEIETEKYGNATYYITDDGSNKIYIFQSYYLGNRKFTANDKLNDGDEVVIYGKFTNYKGNTPETVGKGASYIYSLNGKTEGGSDTPTPGESKGDGSQANPYNAAAANKAAAALSSSDKLENIYVSGIVSKIKEISTSYGNATYYLSEDGTTSGEQFEVFRGLFTNGAKFTSEDQLKVGQKVTVLGTLVNYMGNTPEMAQGSKIVSIEGSGTTPETPETPNNAISRNKNILTLTNSAVTAGSESISFDFNAQGLANATKAKDFTLEDGTKIIFDANGEKNGPTYYEKSKGIRVYLNNTVSFNGVKKIAKIVITCDMYTDNKNGVTTYYTGNEAAKVTFDGNNILFTNSDPNATKGGIQLRIQKITITYAK